MKRFAIAAVAFVSLLTASAQVEKQVEVSKEFVPQVNTLPTKMSITPNMVDTVTLRPEIDYTITPRSFASTLGTHRFRPATLTYWEYRRQFPFYLKLGVGYPLNTSGDFYATTHRADVGFLTGYVNHRGEYGKIKYQSYNPATGEHDAKAKDNPSIQMTNRVGVYGGKYCGRYTLLGEAYYNAEMYDRYPLRNRVSENEAENFVFDKREVDFEDVNLALRFGDAFTDLSHLNFTLYGSFAFFNDKSHKMIDISRYHSCHQIDVTAGGAIARRITPRSEFRFDVDYEGHFGLKHLRGSKNSILSAALIYERKTGGMFDFGVGVRFTYDHNKADVVKRDRYHPFPYLRLALNINERGLFVPYIEVDGELRSNDYRSLLAQNHYASALTLPADVTPLVPFGFNGSTALPNTAIYNVRLGVSGHTSNNKFAYRLWANMSFHLNSLYWYNVNQLFFNAEVANREIWSLCAAIDYKPISQLLITAQLKGSLYGNHANVNDALPPVEALVKVRYTHKRFAVGARAELIGTTTWSCFRYEQLFDAANTAAAVRYNMKTPAAVDLGLFAEVRASNTCTVFVEGNNLANMDIYRMAYYREQGASFTAGVKLQF